MGASVDANKGDSDEKMKIFRDKFSSILDKLIEIFEHMLHQIRISFPDNDVEDEGLSKITKSTSKTKTSKSDPSSF